MANNLEKLYEVETHRTNISPKQFYSHCRRLLKKKANIDLSSWVDDFDTWQKPLTKCSFKNKHEDWDSPLLEIGKFEPLEMQVYLENNYNFIFEWFDGVGYMYCMEYDRNGMTEEDAIYESQE